MKLLTKLATVDFETDPIERRPKYPPVPVGVALRMPEERKARYWRWGHPSGNNCSFSEAKQALSKAWKHGMLFHNDKFDYDVALQHMDMKPVNWDKLHDTLFLLFLHNPHMRNLSLKPASETLLGMPPEEQSAVVEWLQTNAPNIRKKDWKGDWIPWEAYIASAPGGVVEPYAVGDITRTDKLFDFLYTDIEQRNMLGCYNRERQLMPILLDNETRGIRVDLDQLRSDIAMYEQALEKADSWLRKRLNVSKDFNIDSDDEFGKALDRAGVISDWVLTPTGKKSVAKKNLTPDRYNDPQVASVYGYRNRLVTCLSVFMRNWLSQAEETGGFIHTNWNQVRQAHGDEKLAGTRSGRLSSNPNFQNLSKNFETKGDGYVHPKFLRVPLLPLVRKYLLPDKGDTWIHRDYSQQELRILAHFEDGDLLSAYLNDPKLDVHNIVQNGMKNEGIDFVRDAVKRFVFQKVYGGGIPAVCGALGCNAIVAKRVIGILFGVLPGYKALEKGIQAMGRRGEPIVTWGGREYFAEPAAYSKKFKRHMTFEYKLLNYLIQGSAADCTKEALIRYHNHPKRQARLLVTVHDEINVSGPTKRVKEEMAILKECMQSVEFDLPMLSEGKIGPNWGTLEKYSEA